MHRNEGGVRVFMHKKRGGCEGVYAWISRVVHNPVWMTTPPV